MRADGRGWGLLGEEGAEWPSRSRAERAVRRGATRCPYEKGLGAAHGRVTTETKLGLELGAPQPLSSTGCRDQPRGSRGPSPASLGDAAARGCAQAVLSQSSPLLINSKCLKNKRLSEEPRGRLSWCKGLAHGLNPLCTAPRSWPERGNRRMAQHKKALLLGAFCTTSP